MTCASGGTKWRIMMDKVGFMAANLFRESCLRLLITPPVPPFGYDVRTWTSVGIIQPFIISGLQRLPQLTSSHVGKQARLMARSCQLFASDTIHSLNVLVLRTEIMCVAIDRSFLRLRTNTDLRRTLM